jgi:glutamyl-tRNA(Gln) amidotransferase subunit E
MFGIPMDSRIPERRSEVELSTADRYGELRDLGFRCGLETHQQLRTPNKLFCRCPSIIRNDTPDAELLRHMRPTLSEFGEYDGTALMEFKTKKQVHYLLYNDSVCTYEMDDTPPFKADRQAVEISIAIAMMFNMSLVDEIHITRKQYLDGSIPTGFQRTAIIGVNGKVPFQGRVLNFFQLSLEEDACREVSDIGHDIFFRTDRLSIPLVESVTAPELYSPAEAAAGAALVGEIMRSTRLVRRGIGSVRQDVNVSIRGGTRVEIKGVPRIGLIEDLCRVEAYRQKALLDLRDSLGAANLGEDSFNAVPLILEGDAAALVTTSHGEPEPGESWIVQVLPRFRDFIHWPTQPGLSFLDEIDGRVRVIACLRHRPAVQVASAELGRMLNLGTDDIALICSASQEDMLTAAQEIVLRVRDAFAGVPSETRQVQPRGNTAFERILPGPDRMYPDTDLPPEPIMDDILRRIAATLPPRPWDRRDEYARLGVPEQLVSRLLNWDSAILFDSIRSATAYPAAQLAWFLTDRKRGSRRAGADWDALGEDGIRRAVVSCSEMSLSLRAAGMVLDSMAADGMPFDQAAAIAAERASSR